MAGTGTTRVTGTLTHTQNTSLDGTRVLAIEGTLDMAAAGRYINRSGTPVDPQHGHDQAHRGRAPSSCTRRSRTTA